MDLIDAAGSLIQSELGLPYAGQEPQNKDSIPAGGLVIIERIGGGMTQFGRTDSPWLQFTVLANSKKKAFDLIRDIRALWAGPRSRVGDFFVYRIAEVLSIEEASLASDPFYRVRCAFEFKTNHIT